MLSKTISIMSLPSGYMTSSFGRLWIAPPKLDGSAGSKVATRTSSVFEGEDDADLSFGNEVVGEVEGDGT